jgi:prepilin-type N-terminal cleavage/methylation domain-containing protein
MNGMRHRDAERGFTVVEMLVAILISAIVLTIVLVSLEANARVTRVQIDVGDVQQSTRASHRGMSYLARMAGRGGLPRPLSVLVQPNVPDDTFVAGIPVEPGTDVLTVRGALNSPIYRVDADDPTAFTLTGHTAQVKVDSVTASGFSQSLRYLESLAGPNGEFPPEAVNVVSRQGDAVYAVAELTGIVFEDVVVDVQHVNVPIRRATVTLELDPAAGEHSAQYLALSAGGAFPAELTSALFVSVVEEYRYYIRSGFADPADDTSMPRQRLCRARMYPGTETVYLGDVANAAVEIADNISDLQIALGIDLDGDGLIAELDQDGNPLAGDADEWLWNDDADEPGLVWDTAPLQFIRLTTLAHTRSPDLQYVSAPLDAIEDHAYGESSIVTGSDIVERRFRRRLLQNVIDVRNL